MSGQQGKPYMMYPQGYGGNMMGMNYSNMNPMAMNQMNMSNMNPINMNQMPSNTSNAETPKRLRVIMSSEERGFYSNLFQIADKDNKGKLVGKEAADFLKKSGLSKEVLKEIWLISAQTDPQHLERDEFYIALRLIALAQNNMEYTEESIRSNYPLPPLPKFDLKSASNFNSSSGNQGSNLKMAEVDDFLINEDDNKKYMMLFNKNKDQENKMSLNKAYQMWTIAGVSNDLMKKILYIVPLMDKSSLNYNEFKVIFHLIYKSLEIDIPSTLPSSLKKVLGLMTEPQVEVKKSNNEINFGDKLGMNDGLSSDNNMGSNVPSSNNNSADIESSLLNEFNLKKVDNNNNLNNSSQAIPSTSSNNFMKMNNQNSSSNILFNNQVNQTNQCQILPKIQQQISYQNPLSSVPKEELLNLKETTNQIYNNTVHENQFLNKVLEEDTASLKNILEDIEKVNKNINLLNEKNKMIRENITEIRRKINLEKDNLSKAILISKDKTNEIISNQSKKLIYINLLFR